MGVPTVVCVYASRIRLLSRSLVFSQTTIPLCRRSRPRIISSTCIPVCIIFDFLQGGCTVTPEAHTDRLIHEPAHLSYVFIPYLEVFGPKSSPALSYNGRAEHSVFPARSARIDHVSTLHRPLRTAETCHRASGSKSWTREP